MAATKKQGVKKAVKKISPAKTADATTLLRADHKLVSDLFADYEKTRSVPKKKQIVEKICTELSVHAQVEEEIFYPAFKLALKDKVLVPEATVEHATLKDLVAQVEGIEPHGEMYDAKIKVLSEYVKHHVKEEHSEMFTKAKTSKLDLVKLGTQISNRKLEILAERSQNGKMQSPTKANAKKARHDLLNLKNSDGNNSELASMEIQYEN